MEPPIEIETIPVTRPATGGVARAAAIISFGSVMSRVLGLVIETIIPYLFGASGYVSVFRVAETFSQTLYDFLVGGMVSAALVPVFSEYAERRDELWRLVGVVLSALAVLLALAVLVLEIFAGQLMLLLGPDYPPALQAAGTQMIRLVLPAVFFLGVAGILTGILYSLKRFAYPAFTTVAYNGGIIAAALALAPRFGINSLVVGILVGAALQVVLQLPGLRDGRLRLTLSLRHPALREILRLYLPVVIGLTVSLVGVTIDRNLASRTGDQSVAWMQQATVLVQFPLGLVVTAISFAILPNLSRALTSAEFRATLAFGIKLVMILILPAALGLFLLAQPIVALLFEHGAFTTTDTFHTANALQLYLLGLPFAAIDQPLVFAFYARKQTLAPNLVAVVGVAVYLVVALALIQSFGYLGLVLANAAQLTAHALVMLWLTHARLGGLGGESVGATLLKILVAALVMGGGVWLVMNVSPGDATFVGKFVQVFLPASTGILIYIAGLKILRVREMDELVRVVVRRVAR